MLKLCSSRTLLHSHTVSLIVVAVFFAAGGPKFSLSHFISNAITIHSAPPATTINKICEITLVTASAPNTARAPSLLTQTSRAATHGGGEGGVVFGESMGEGLVVEREAVDQGGRAGCYPAGNFDMAKSSLDLWLDDCHISHIVTCSYGFD